MPDPSLRAQLGAHDTELHTLPGAHGSTADQAHDDAPLGSLTTTTSAPGASSDPNRHNVAPDAGVKSAQHSSNFMGINSADEKAAASSADGAAAGTAPSNSTTTTTTTITAGDGGFVAPDEQDKDTSKHPPKGFFHTFGVTLWAIITSSYVNVLLVFVPVGIAVAQIDSLKGPVAFSMNAIAIIPLAGLLSFATESVAAQMGDAIGALMNVTFGNAVELIIFIIALTKGEIRIVQASLLGSILSNLLLILGMCFLFGGLRYREQIYNSTVTQMSACLLSLSVCSLVLPTAFHASFKNEAKADADTLKVSRGTSVILLLVYGLYLLFQLKSHAYMYESTPQHIVDAEATPGPAAGWLDSSSSSETSSSDSSDSDSSRDTVRKRMKKVLHGRRRKDSDTSAATGDSPVNLRSPAIGTSGSPDLASEAMLQMPTRTTSGPTDRAGLTDNENEDATAGADESSDDERWTLRARRRKHKRKNRAKKEKKRQKRLEERRAKELKAEQEQEAAQSGRRPSAAAHAVDHEPRRVDFAVSQPTEGQQDDGMADDATSVNNPRRSFPALRGISVRTLRPSVFTPATPPAPAGPVPRVRYGIRRTNSLPDRLTNNGVDHSQVRPPGALFPARIPAAALVDDSDGSKGAHEHLSRPMAIALLLISTALVAVCAEFMVDSIEPVTQAGGVPELFIGLIILPIVGNAAEHVTAITVAMKNKMDLAIGVAIGSSIQIALLVTPFIVILGWILDHDMTLYFTLFETVCLFVSAFIVNFLVLDGRSNYLEGALLCATYVIIAVVAFFSPQGDDANQFGE